MRSQPPENFQPAPTRLTWRQRTARYALPAAIVAAVVAGTFFLFYIALYGVGAD